MFHSAKELVLGCTKFVKHSEKKDPCSVPTSKNVDKINKIKKTVIIHHQKIKKDENVSIILNLSWFSAKQTP